MQPAERDNECIGTNPRVLSVPFKTPYNLRLLIYIHNAEEASLSSSTHCAPPMKLDISISHSNTIYLNAKNSVVNKFCFVQLAEFIGVVLVGKNLRHTMQFIFRVRKPWIVSP